MTGLAVLTVLESTLTSFCLSYKIQCQETTVVVCGWPSGIQNKIHHTTIGLA